MPNKTAKQVFDEFIRSPIGQPISYYRGFLMRDVEKEIGMRVLVNEELERLRDAVWEMYEEGRVLLTQKKHGNNDYEYFMTKRERTRTNAFS